MAKVFAISSGRDIRLLNELIKFSSVDTPRVLIIPHSQKNEKNGEEKIYETTKGFFHNTFVFEQYKKKNFNKWFKALTSSDLKDQQKVSDFLSWANIYYVPPGDTFSMLNLWNDTGFSETLKEASLNNKILAGTSAGANCWFSSFTSLTSVGLKEGKGLGIVNAHMTAHGDDLLAKEFHQNIAETKKLLGFCMVRDTAVAIDGEEYRIIVPKRYIGLSENTEFPLVTNLEDGRYSYTEVKKTTEYHRTENKLVLKK